MASFKRNIHHNIQVGLDARVDAMNRYHHSRTNYRSGLLGSAKTSTDYELTREAQLGKSTYVRMISPGTLATHVIYGGFNIDDIKMEGESSGTDDYFKSVADRITGPETAYYETATDHGSLKGLRPKAGITNVNVLFQGYGGAVRKATVTWTCFSLEQLAMYQKGSFLSPGQTIILDWGWVRSDPAMKNREIPKFLIKEGEKVTLNKDLFDAQTEKVNGEEFTKFTPVWDQLEIKQYGDWSGIIGPVTKFTWSQRGDGGFDCITEMLSRGSNIFEKQLPEPSPDKGGALATFPSPRLTHDQFVNAVVKKAIKEDDNLPNAEKLIKIEQEMPKVLPSKPLFNISERIDTLDYEIIGKYFSEQIETEEKGGPMSAKLSVEGDYQIVWAGDKNVFAILRPSGADGSDTADLYEADDETVDEAEKKYTRARDFSNEIWVRWGWFEDNVVSYFARDSVTVGKNTVRLAEFRSLTEKPGDTKEGHKNLTSVLIKNSEYLKTYDPSVFIIGDKYDHGWFHDHPTNDKIDKSYYELAKGMRDHSYSFKDIDTPEGKGKLRNLYINLSIIKRSFTGAGTTIKSGMLSMAKSLNAGINLWDFEVDSVEGLNAGAQRTFFIKETGDDQNDESAGACKICNKEESQLPSKSYIFDNYGENSLIQDISLTATVPDKFAIVAGYGMESGKSNQKTDAIKQYFTDTIDSSTEAVAAAVGEFYSHKENENLFKPTMTTNPDELFGNRTEEYTGVANLSNDGLTPETDLFPTKWNHTILPDLTETSTSTRVSGVEHFKKKYDAAMTKQKQDAARNRDQGKDFEAEHLFPNPMHPDTDAGKEEAAPYSLSDGKLKPSFVSAFRWLLVDCPATRLKSHQKEIIMPINIDMTLEGLGGIYPGNMFRLSYLPESYGQVNFKDGEPDATPATFFTIMGLTQTINQEGWQTKVTAVTNKATQETEGDAKTMKAARLNVERAFSTYMDKWSSGDQTVPE